MRRYTLRALIFSGIAFGVILAAASSSAALVTIAEYDSGVTAAVGQSGAADPEDGAGVSAWTKTGTVSAYSDGYDSGNGGWTIVDGTSGSPWNYQHNLSAADTALMAYGWTATFKVGVNADAVPAAGGGVNNYYTAVPSRQNNNIMIIQNVGDYSYILTFKNDGSGNVIVNDGTTDFNVNAVACQQHGGSDTMDYVTFTLTYDVATTTATLSDDKGSTLGAIATSGSASADRVVFGAGSSSGQGSTTWNTLELQANDGVVKADNTDNLNLGSSWTTGAAPGSGDLAIWDSSVTGAISNNLGANLSWKGLQIDDPGGDVTIGGANSLTLGSDGLDVGANRNLTFHQTSPTDLNGPLAGSTILTVDGGSSSKDNWSDMGSTTFTGTLQLRGGSGAYNGGRWIAFGGGTVSQTGSFALDTGASAADAASIILREGWGNGVSKPKLSLSSLSGYGDFRTDWGSSDPADRPRTISVNQLSDTTFDGRIVENNNSTRQIGFEKLGVGKLTLTADNNFTGGTVIHGGTIEMERADSLGDATSGNTLVTVHDGTLDLSFDVNSGAYGSATANWTALFDTLTLGGAAGATPTILTSGIVGSGASLGIDNQIVYDAANDPGTATISGRWITVGATGTSSREIAVGDSAATDTELEISGQMSATGQNDGRSTTIKKTGAGTLKISGQNNFPVMQVEGGKLIANHAQALGTGRTLANSLILTNGTLEADGADRSYSTPVTLAAESTNTISGDTYNLTLTGLVSGGGALEKTGDSELTLTAGNTYSGGTTIEDGVLAISGSGKPGTGDVTINSPAVLIAKSAATISNDLQGDGTLVKTNANNLVLTGSNTFSGTIEAAGSWLVLDGVNATVGRPDLFMNAGGVALGGAYGGETVTLGDLYGSGQISGAYGGAGTRTVSVQQTTDRTYSGTISDGGGTRPIALTKLGAAKLTLSGANGYTGTTTVEAGTLTIGDGAGSGSLSSGAVIVSNGATFAIDYGATGQVYGNDFSGEGTLRIEGGQDPQFSGDNSGFTGPVIIDGASAEFRTRSATAWSGQSVVTVTNGGMASVFSYVDDHDILAGSLWGDGTVRLGSGGNHGLIVGGNNQDAVFSGTIVNDVSGSGFVTKTGTGVQTLSGANSYSGATTIEGGTLKLGHKNGIGNISGHGRGFTLRNGTVDINGQQSYTHAGGSPAWLINGEAITLGGQAGGAMVIANSVPGTSAGFTLFNLQNCITYDAANDPGTATIAAPWYGTGASGAATKTITVGDSAATSVELDFTGQVGQNECTDGQQTTIQKAGAGTMRISAANYFPVLEILGGRLIANDDQALGVDRTLANSLTMNNGTLAAGGANRSFSTPVTLDANTTNTLAGATYDLELSGVVSGSGVLHKDEAATAILSGESTYTASTDVEAGTLQIGNGGATGNIGIGAVTVSNGASLVFNRTGTLDYKASTRMRDVSGEGDVELDGGVTVFNYPGGGGSFSGANTWNNFSGTLRVLGGSEFKTIRNGATAMGTGTIELGDGATSGHLSQTEGNWTWTNPIDVVGAANEIRNRSGGSGRSLKLQGVIDGSGGLTLTDTASSMTSDQTGFILTGANILTGTLTVDGPVRVGGVPGDSSDTGAGTSGSLGSADVVINSGETLTFSRTDSHVVSAAISGDGAVDVGLASGTGSQTVILTGNSTHAGTTTINEGTLQVGNGGTSGAVGSGPIVNGGALVLNRSDAALDMSNGISGGGSLTKMGSGAVTLSGANTYTSDTTSNDGTLKAGSATAFGSTTVWAVGGGTIDANGQNLSSKGFTGSSGTIDVGSGTVTVGATATGDNTFSADLTGSGTLAKEGGYQLRLQGASVSCSGTIRPNNGLIIVNPTGGNLTGEPDLYFSSTDGNDGIVFGNEFNGGTISLGNLDGTGSENAKIRCDWGANGFRTLSVNQSVDGTFAGVIAQSTAVRDFSLVKTGSATLTLSGANTYAQGTTVSDGTLLVSNASGSGTGTGTLTVQTGATVGGVGTVGGVATVQSGGVLAPGASAGTLTFSAGLALDAGSTLNLELGTSSDLVRVSGGTLTCPAAGTVTINVSDAGGLADEVYTLIDWNGATPADVDVDDFTVNVPGGVFSDIRVAIQGSKLILSSKPGTVFRFR